MLKEIKKEDIPDWEYGDVSIKSFSYGESAEIGNLKASMNDKGEAEIEKGSINVKDISIKGLAAGIHFVRTKDGSQFIIKPGTILKEREEKVYAFERLSGAFLLTKIWELNKPMSKQQQKN